MAKAKEVAKPEMSLEQNARERALNQAISMIEKTFGKGAIMCLGKSSETVQIATVPSGSIGLDLALGVGGFPRGRIIEIYGPEASGKTTVALHAVAECQKANGIAAFIDAEHALDTHYARRLGVDIDKLWVSQPDFGEQALDIADALVKSNAVDIIVVDSVAALVPKAELDGEMGDAHVGLQARLMSQALRKLTASVAKSKTVLIFINQLRSKVGVIYGSSETTTGGNALKYYSSVRLDVRKTQLIKNGQEAIGQRTRIKVAKNKIAPPFKEIEVDIIYGQGISREGDLLDLGVSLGVVDKAGAWYSFEGERLGNGRDACRIFLSENPEISKAIENRIREAKNLPKLEEVMSVKEEALDPSEEIEFSEISSGTEMSNDPDVS